MKWLKPLFLLVLSFALFYLLNFPTGQTITFPVGKFFNPFGGFWHNNVNLNPVAENLELPGVVDPVAVLWDDRGVPHIFAQNGYDLYFIQGYLTARDRLWQMEFLTYVASGRLAEILGDKPNIVEHDRFRRRIGMVYAAENALKAYKNDLQSQLVLKAYSEGVNAWIKQLDEKNLPIEYKILDYRPEAWTPLKTALVQKYMAWNLSFRNDELAMTKTKAAAGDSLMEALFHRDPFMMKPVIPKGSWWWFKPEAAPAPPDSQFSPNLADMAAMYNEQPSPFVGSNNWAVSGKKTANGYPILCNDPHLGLTLPSIWYEVQLVSPDVNVYGVSLPGSPSVIIGFNQNIAWGVTNAGTDVMDWYEVQLKDPSAREYSYNGQWLQTTQRLETIKIKNKPSIVDTVAYTHHGPLSYLENEAPFGRATPVGAALRWTAHDSSNELSAFLGVNRAKNYQDFTAALEDYDCPAQNFVFASRKGDIALHHQGKFPIRWRRQGRYISDGRNPAYDWSGYIPADHVPKIRNPRNGVVASANQNATDKKYKYKLYGGYATFERGARIYDRLWEMEDITPEDMMKLQNDNLNLRALTVLPALTAVLQNRNLTNAQQQILEALEKWDFYNERASRAPVIFEHLWDEVETALWEDDLPADSNGTLIMPNAGVTMDFLINDTSSIFFDNRTTAEREGFSDIVFQAFKKAHEKLIREYGSFGDNWQWGKVRGTDLRHFARVPGLGRTGLPTDGNYAIVNATRKHNGPSWRMIVEMGPQPRAWGIYPGGQNGNPGDNRFDQFVDSWVDGKYYELLYLKSPTDIHQRLVAKTVIRNPETASE